MVNYLKDILRKKLSNFCNKAPIDVRYTIEDKIIIKTATDEKEFSIVVEDINDLENIAKDIIFKIKQWLVNEQYPRLLESIYNKQGDFVKHKEYIIYRFVEAQQFVFLYDFESGRRKKYQMGALKSPKCAPFMIYQTFIEEYFDKGSEIMAEIFFKKSAYIYNLRESGNSEIDTFGWAKRKFT